MDNIGKRIRETRKQKKLTQDQLAAVLGTTKAAISRYETGARHPSYAQLSEISNALGVSVLDLLQDYVEVKNELGETNVYLRELGGEVEDMFRTCGLPLKADFLLSDDTPNVTKAFVSLIQEGTDGMAEPLLKAFQKLDFFGRQMAVDFVESLASNPAFLRKDLHSNQQK
jgi:transcriptional regulator with XRE-family HTH domain